MDFLRSIFGAYAEAAALQAIIDNSNARFNVPFWNKYFTLGTPQVSLTYVTAIGKTRVDAAASVVSRDARTPLRSRASLARLNGEIPAIKVMKTLNEDDYRTYLTFQSLQISDAAKKQQILNLIFGDIQSVVNSVNKRLDYMVLEGMSTGYITVTADNNPDGIILDNIDLLMPAANFQLVAKAWSDPTSKPITDLRNTMTAIKALYKQVSKILITEQLLVTLLANAETLSVISAYNNPGSNNKVLATLDNLNTYMVANRWPTFEVIDEVVYIEIDGKNTAFRPFKNENLVFIPDGSLGEIKNAIAIEELTPVTQVGYSKNGNILVSKWFANEPFGEHTKAEWNAFPGFEQIENMFIMKTDTVAP